MSIRTADRDRYGIADELHLIAHEPAAFDRFYYEHIDAVQGFVVRRSTRATAYRAGRAPT